MRHVSQVKVRAQNRWSYVRTGQDSLLARMARFSTGLATTLHHLGTPDKEIQGILRHSNVAITQASYIKCMAESQVNALDLVAAEMGSNESCNQNATEAKTPVN